MAHFTSHGLMLSVTTKNITSVLDLASSARENKIRRLIIVQNTNDEEVRGVGSSSDPTKPRSSTAVISNVLGCHREWKTIHNIISRTQNNVNTTIRCICNDSLFNDSLKHLSMGHT